MSSDDQSKTTRTFDHTAILRRADQVTVAVLVLGALVALAAYWVSHGGCRGEMIEIERVGPLDADFRVDINQAQWPEFAQLPGVGETLARRIVDSRTRDGPFTDHVQLLRVHGIGPTTLKRIRPYLLPLPGGHGMVKLSDQ